MLEHKKLECLKQFLIIFFTSLFDRSFTKTNSMAEAFKDADIVYPKSWASFEAMKERTDFYAEGNLEGIKELEKNNVKYIVRFNGIEKFTELNLSCVSSGVFLLDSYIQSKYFVEKTFGEYEILKRNK